MSLRPPTPSSRLRIFNQVELDIVISNFLASFTNEQVDALNKIDTKTLDPIIFALDYRSQGGTFDWQNAALNQAVRKTREGRIGKLHQDLIALIPGWVQLAQQNADPDLVCEDKKIIVELKSREDTVKGSDLVGIYDNLLNATLGAYRGYTGFFAYILNKSRKSRNEPNFFTPPDNATQQTRQQDPRVLQVDGKLLWAIVCDTGNSLHSPYSRPDAIFDVYAEVFESILRIGGSTVDPVVLSELNQLAVRNFTPTPRVRRNATHQ